MKKKKSLLHHWNGKHLEISNTNIIVTKLYLKKTKPKQTKKQCYGSAFLLDSHTWLWVFQLLFENTNYYYTHFLPQEASAHSVNPPSNLKQSKQTEKGQGGGLPRRFITDKVLKCKHACLL